MRGFSFLIVASAGLLPLLPETASATVDTTIRHVLSLQSGGTTDTPGPPAPPERTFTFGDGYLIVRDSDQTLLFDGRARLLIWTDATHATRLETPLPIRPLALLGEVSTLRYLEEPPLRLRIAASTETRRIAGHECRRYLLTAGADDSPNGSLWVATDLGNEGARMAALAGQWWRLRFPLAPDEDVAAFEEFPGPVLEGEWTESAGGRTVALRTVCAGVQAASPPAGRPVGGSALSPKSRMTYRELLEGRLGPPQAARTAEENTVLTVLRRFQDGFRGRDSSTLEAWIAELMAPDVLVLGTDGAWPGSWEWRGGHQAAREMFERDWRRWGGLKIFEDEMYLSVDGDAAWAAAFATVVRAGSDEDASRRRAAARLREYAQSDWPSRRILYEAIADAAQVLVQYERDDEFVTPLRAEFGLVRRAGVWRLKMVHFSHPATGFRPFRLLHAPPDLVRLPGGLP